MSFDTPLVEYLIIGVHTSTWIYFVFLKSLDFPIATASKIDTAIVLLLLPFIYIVGMIFDDITYRILRPRIKIIKESVRRSWEKKKNKGNKSPKTAPILMSIKTRPLQTDPKFYTTLMKLRSEGSVL